MVRSCWLVKFELPEEPKPEDFKTQTFKFTSRTAQADGSDVSFDLPREMKFVGVVQVADQPVFRAVFFSQTDPLEKAFDDYNKELDSLVAEAGKEGVTITSLDQLKSWAAGESDQPIDFAAVVEKMKANETQPEG